MPRAVRNASASAAVLPGVIGEAGEDEVALAGADFQPQAAKLLGHPRPPLAHQRLRLLDEGVVVQRRETGGLGGEVDVEGGADAVHRVDHGEVAVGPAHPHPGQAEDLGEGAADDHVRVPPRQIAPVIPLGVVAELGVGAVQQQDAVGGKSCVQALHLGPPDPGAGRVAGIVEEDEAGAVVHLGQDGVHVDAQVRLGGEAHLPLRGADGDAVGEEAVRGLDGVVAGLKERLREEGEHLVRPAAEDQLLGLQVILARDGLAQAVGAGVGVEGEVQSRLTIGLHRLRARTEHVLVGRELQGVSVARRLGLARDVGRDVQDAGFRRGRGGRALQHGGDEGCHGGR